MTDPTPSVAQALTELSNPASGAEVRRRAPRIPMSTARTKLQVPSLPGFHMHWFKEDNVPAALDAYYEFVDRGEVSMNQLNVSLEGASTGTDMGSRVSLIADKTESGSPVRAYLMKIREEYWLEDQQAIEVRNSSIMQAIFGDEAKVDTGQGLKPLDSTSYRETALFNRPARKAVIRKRR